MSPPALADLSPATLIKAHFADADEAFKTLPPIQQTGVKHSGPQGKVEPFTVVDDPSAWYAADYRGKDEQWTYTFTAEDLTELKAAVDAVEAKGLAINGNLVDIKASVPSVAEFPLPTLGPKLTALLDAAKTGRGFQLLRGLPVEKWTRLQTLIAYWGFSLYWGKTQSQNAKGHIIGHVKNIGHATDNPITRVYATALAQPFHTDPADIVVLLCLKKGKSGGLSSWTSSITAHNELLKRGRKDLVEELAKDQWWVDRKGEIPPDAKAFYSLPIFNYHKGYLSVNFAATAKQQYYELAQRHEELPRLTAKQKEALAAFVALAKSDELRLDTVLQPGDVQLLSNHVQLHTRSAFEDYEDPAERRHLLRLWVSPKPNRELPDAYANLWQSTEVGDRGGIFTTAKLQTVPLEAE